MTARVQVTLTELHNLATAHGAEVTEHQFESIALATIGEVEHYAVVRAVRGAK